MKQFNKYGVAVAVAAVAAAANATVPSPENTGDLAIVPYYTVEGGKNTGVHIINTTDATQVVKFRMRRGADSKDAMDFNVVLSPFDEWTASIQAGGATGVQVVTADTSCTVPAFTNGVASMPSTYATGATEGYIEVIGMASADENQPISIAALHKDGVPADCASVRANFFRVSTADAGIDPAVRGVHFGDTTSNGACDSAAISAAATADACFGKSVSDNVSEYGGTEDTALAVSYFIRDADGGLEFGNNAIMVQGFAPGVGNGVPMMTNQQPLVFNSAGLLEFDPLNFELPNLGFGAYDVDRTSSVSAVTASTDGSMWNDLRGALGVSDIANDWSDKTVDAATVNTDWVVTLPGQYLMQDNVCAAYDSYAQSQTACAATNTAGTDLVSLDQDELPLFIASFVDGGATVASGKWEIFDREEGVLASKDSTAPTPDEELGFSPGGQATDPDAEPTDAELKREVNVIVWSQDTDSMGVLDSAADQSEALGLRTVVSVPGDATNGWARLSIEPDVNVNDAVGANDYQVFVMNAAGSLVAGDLIAPAQGPSRTYGAFDSAGVTGGTPVVGFAVWQRNFGANASANYGRAVDHAVTSDGGPL